MKQKKKLYQTINAERGYAIMGNEIIRANGENGAYLDTAPMYLFNKGENYYSYKMLGAHKAVSDDGKEGYLFSVWAPNAANVSVVCDTNGWNAQNGRMLKHKNSGIWERFIEGVTEEVYYKFLIETPDGRSFMKADPYAFYSEKRPRDASLTYDLSYTWSDEKWMEKRRKTPPYDKPVSIYEVHLGSWKRKDDGSCYNYKEIADELIPYVKKMGYTHIEVMPITEYPYDGSWGYQVCGYYSVTSRYGTPTDFKYFVNKCHKSGIGIIMDWVPAHFPKDGYGLAQFDGTALYENPDSRLGEHYEWGTLVFDYKKTEIFSFLISNAIFWFEEYHLDGFRVDAVSSMLYLDYNRENGQWLPNKYGGKEYLEAIDFLQKLNKAVFERFPNVLMIAEESTAWGGVTKPVHDGGLGFNYKWNMGWMNDVLRYMGMDPYFRRFNHSMITFSFMYAFSENYILAFSHDEVVHGKKSLIDKMYGTYEEKFASLRLLYAYMFAHPGKKLNFMGGEFAQFIEWRFAEGLDWGILEFDKHRQMQEYTAALNKFYAGNKSMYENDSDWDGFEWINADDSERSIISFIRTSRSGKERTIFVGNFTPVKYEKYRIGVPSSGEYEIIFGSNDEIYGGDDESSSGSVFKAKKVPFGNFKYSLELTVPPLSALFLRHKAAKRTKKVENSESKLAEKKIISKSEAEVEVKKTSSKTKSVKTLKNTDKPKSDEKTLKKVLEKEDETKKVKKRK